MIKVIKVEVNEHQSHKKLKAKNNYYDLIIIPNLIHHIDDHDILIRNVNLF